MRTKGGRRGRQGAGACARLSCNGFVYAVYLMNYEAERDKKCFSCPGDCKELSEETKRSTYDSNQARTKPWLT